MALSRRTFFKLTAVGATTAVGLTPNAAEASTTVATGTAMGVLVDVSKCIGCRSCEAACAKANGLPDPDWSDDMLVQEAADGHRQAAHGGEPARDQPRARST